VSVINKKLITKQDVDKWYFEGIKEIYVDDNTMILPGAKDALMAAGITVKTKKDCSELEQIRKVVDEYCKEKNIDGEEKEKIIKSVIAKCSINLGGE